MSRRAGSRTFRGGEIGGGGGGGRGGGGGEGGGRGLVPAGRTAPIIVERPQLFLSFDFRFLSAFSLGATLGAGCVEAMRVRVRRFDVHLENLPPQAEEMRIVQVSDLHAGMIAPLALTRHILQLAQNENPDVLVLTGDLVSRRGSYFPLLRPFAPPITEYARRLEPLLRELSAPLGVWAVAGNHDLWQGANNELNPGDFAPVARHLEAAGIAVLLNQSARLSNGLALVGTDDLREGAPDVRFATRDVSPDEAQIVLSHNPRLAALFADRNALILSGHTHGGQAKLPPPFRLYPIDSMSSSWQSGWWKVGRAQLYVSTGAGYIGGPYRLGVPPEIAVFTLRSGSKAI